MVICYAIKLEVLLFSVPVITLNAVLMQRFATEVNGIIHLCTHFILRFQERRDQGDEHADMDFKDLKRLSVECEGWIRTAGLLIQDVMGDDFVFQDLSAVKKEKGPDRAVSADSKATGGEVIFILLYQSCKQNLFFLLFILR